MGLSICSKWVPSLARVLLEVELCSWRWQGDSPTGSFGVLGSLFFLQLIPDCSSGSFSLQATRHLAPPCSVPGRLTL